MLVLGNIKECYDGKSSEKSSLLSGIDIFVDKGKITDIRPHQEDSKKLNVTYLDCTGLTVTPSLIDCHSHITSLGINERGMTLMQSQHYLLYVEKILYTTLVDGGVTTVRDVGGGTHLMKRLVDEGVIIGPRLKIAICMLSTTGGHADFRSTDRLPDTPVELWGEIPGRPSNIVDGPENCRKRVREIVACGADLIKICASPGVASPSDYLENRDFTKEEIAAICDEAAARGLPVAAHAHSKNGIELAIDNGVKDIQHISFMDQRLADKAAAKGCTVTPTSWIVRSLKDVKGLSPFVAEKAAKAFEFHGKATEVARKAGLKILGGTDPVIPEMHGKNYLELHHLIQEGLSPLQAWFGMTGLAAKEIGVPDSGFLSKGQRADLLVCRGDVVQKPELIGQGALLEVMKDGEAYRGHFPQLAPRTFSTGMREHMIEVTSD